ncbi:hypothetical protein [Streptomyces sp. NPDC090025]|uniref:hypothetical protein n=1 Tax=Streptomyces sp. NPDC090025 TaxID=3365922 RepID=UPI0038325AFD
MAAAVVDDSGAFKGALSMVPLLGGPAVVAAAAAAMAYEVVELSKLRNDVKALLDDFKESDAGPGKVGAEWLEQGALAGPGFHEADFLFSTYDVVRRELVMFSKVLGLQMESMQIAIDLAKTGYENIDDDLKARMSTLNTQITDLQLETRPENPLPDKSGGTPQNHPPVADGDDSTQGF